MIGVQINVDYKAFIFFGSKSQTVVMVLLLLNRLRDRGMMWTIVRYEVLEKYPTLSTLIQSAANAHSHVTQQDFVRNHVARFHKGLILVFYTQGS